MDLHKERVKILGPNFGKDVYSRNMDWLHPPAEPNSFFKDEDEQTYEEFVDMGRRNPNVMGTGRWKLNSRRKKLLVIYMGDKSPELDIWVQLKELYSAYFCLEVDFINQNGCVDISHNEVHISRIGASKKSVHNIQPFMIREKKRKRAAKEHHQEATFDVFSFFDALVEMAQPPYISVIAFVDCKIGEDDGVGGFHEVMGRACGDRVCVVSLRQCDSLKSLICVGLHECLHTVGFDHCNSWKCVMNAIDVENWPFMSPVNLRKFKQMHNIPDDDHGFLLERYKRMLSCIDSFGDDLKDYRQWLQNKIEFMETNADV
jgi:predicted Zn-dependent protease